MSTIELKNRIHSLVETINDDDMLQAILTLLNRSDKVDWWDELTPEQQESIDKGLKDIEEGRVHSHEDVMNRMKAKYPQLY